MLLLMQDKAIKLKLECSKQTDLIVDGQSKICNWLYNHLLEKAKELKKQFIKTQDKVIAQILYTKRGLRNLIPNLKKENPFLKTVHSSPLKNAALRLSGAIQDYQKGNKGKRKNKTGWPVFRSWRAKWFSLFYDEPNKGFKVLGNKLILSLGTDENGKRLSVEFVIKDIYRLKGYNIRNLRLVKENNIFYAIFVVKTKIPEKKPIKRVIALDPNHKNMAYGVDLDGKSTEIKAPYWLKILDKIIDELKSKRDRCKKYSKKIIKEGKEYFIPSRRWLKFDRALKKALQKRKEQTKTYLFTLAHKICRYYDCIGIGNYTPRGGGITKKMKRGMNNRSLIGRFKEVLSWIAQKSGKIFIEYDERGTTRECYRCKNKIEEVLDPSIRFWECPVCKMKHHRDENASLNGLEKILNYLKKSGMYISLVPGSGLVFVKKRCAWCVFPSGVKETLRGENCSFELQAPRNSIESMRAFDQNLVIN